MTVNATRHAALAYHEQAGLWPHEVAGLRRVYKGRGRERNLLVGLYRNDEAGLDDDGGRQPWSTVCERHHHVISHDTRAIAESWVTAPDQWCEGCRPPLTDSE